LSGIRAAAVWQELEQLSQNIQDIIKGNNIERTDFKLWVRWIK
jgi:hypothetical protein